MLELPKPKIYVGCFVKSPVSACYPPGYVHPRNFDQYYAGLPHDCYSNHPYFVSCAAFEDVMVVADDGNIKPLTEWPEFERWKDEMSPGEMWSLAGENWARKT